MKKFVVIFGVVCNFLFASALACAVLPSGDGLSTNRMIELSSEIFLVKVSGTPEVEGVKKVVPRGGVVELEVLEVLKGDDSLVGTVIEQKNIHVTYYPEHQTDFNNHEDEKFWREGIGRSSYRNYAMCGVSHTFLAGEIMLYFADMIGHSKALEVIRTPDDKWLLYVRKKIAERTNTESKAQ